MILLPCTVYRIAHTRTPATIHSIVHTALNIRLVGFRSHVLASRDSLLWAPVEGSSHTVTRFSFPSHVYVSFSKQTLVMTLKVYCSCTLQCILNLMEQCISCCYAINVSNLGWSHNGFHECSVTMLSNFISDVLLNSGAALVVYRVCHDLGHNCRRWFPRFLWSKKFIETCVRFWTVTELRALFNFRSRSRVNRV